MTRVRCKHCVPNCPTCGAYFAVQSLADACQDRHNQEAEAYLRDQEEEINASATEG